METSSAEKGINVLKRMKHVPNVETKAEPESKPEPISVPIVAAEPPKLEVTVQEPKIPTLEERVGMLENILNNILLKIKEAQAAQAQQTQIQPTQGQGGIMQYLPLIQQAMGTGGGMNDMIIQKAMDHFFKSAERWDSLGDSIVSRIAAKEVAKITDAIDK